MSKNLTFFQTLEQKEFEYGAFDIQRMPRIYKKIKDALPQKKIIHIIGTNGKGSTGRFLSRLLRLQDFKVGHYSSPHIMSVNERFWLDGKNVTHSDLENAAKKLSCIVDEDDLKELSYFEYLTLIAIFVFERCDYLVFEAGLGGEYDATAVFEQVLSIVTPIGFDHQQFLGADIVSIASTKLRSIKNRAVVAQQKYDEVLRVLQELNIPYIYADDIDRLKNFDIIEFQRVNLSCALGAMRELGVVVEDEEIRKCLEDFDLVGRMQKIAPNIVIDVGHNELAAKALIQSLPQKNYTLVFNILKDKEYEKVLEILKPLIEKIEIIPIESSRKTVQESLVEVIQKLGIKWSFFDQIDKRREYLVFGSFLSVEAFIKKAGFEKSL